MPAQRRGDGLEDRRQVAGLGLAEEVVVVRVLGGTQPEAVPFGSGARSGSVAMSASAFVTFLLWYVPDAIGAVDVVGAIEAEADREQLDMLRRQRS